MIVYSRGQGGRGRAITQAAGAQFISADSRKLDHDLEKDVGPLDIVIEATGYSPLAFAAMDVVGPNGVVCLTGISPGSRDLTIDASHLNLEIVLTNKLLFGTVNANRRHFENGILHMQAIEERWPGLLYTMITRRVPLERFTVDDIDKPGDLKVEKGHEVVGYNRSEQKTKELERDGLIGAYSFEELAAKLDPPRIVLIYVTHGDATEDVCQALRPILQSSDIVADCGNSNWRDSRRRHVFFQEADIHFLDIGTSGGLAGARSGACFMAGGESRAYEVVAHF